MRRENDWHKRRQTVMAWAVRDGDGRAIHVSALTREQTGLACLCHCSGCNAPLEAVNAGQPPSHFEKGRAQRMHFRHASGQQGEACRLSVASRVALQLMGRLTTTRVPGPKRVHRVVGASGKVYEATAQSAPADLVVHGVDWIDEQSAVLTLASGRVILVKLRAHTTSGRDDAMEAVLTIDVDDPDVANMGAEEILARVQLQPDWVCWDRHWDDAQLSAQAKAEAVEKMRQAMDVEQTEFSLPDHATPADRAETALHWHLKQILAEGGVFRSPAYKAFEKLRLPDGTQILEPVLVAAMDWYLTELRLERRLGNVVPDVLCMATPKKPGWTPVEMMIEVAVSHRVDGVKLAKIQSLDVPCIEIDALPLQRESAFKLDLLRELTWNGEQGKEWIHHPEIKRLHVAARSRLSRRQQEWLREQEQQKERARAAELREADRRQRLLRRSDAEVLTAYVTLTAKQDALAPGDVAKDSEGWTAADMREQLLRRSLGSALGEELSGRNGLLRQLVKISRAAGSQREGAIALSVLQAVMSRSATKAWAPVVAMAVRIFNFDLGESRQEFDALTSKMKASIKHGYTEFARDGRFDKVIALMFPGLQPGLNKPGGTLAYAADQARARREREAAEREAQRIAELARREEAQRLEAIARQQELDLAEARKTIEAYSPMQWARSAGAKTSEARIVERLCQLRKLGQPSGELATLEVIAAALESRDRGETVAQWLVGCHPKTANAVRTLVLPVREAFLLTPGPA